MYQMDDHVVIFDEMEKPFHMDGVLLENEWNHVVCTVSHNDSSNPCEAFIKQIGIYVFKQGSNMDDIQFTQPL